MKFRPPITHVEIKNIKTYDASCFCAAVFKYFPVYELSFDADIFDSVRVFLGLYGTPETIPDFSFFVAEIASACIIPEINIIDVLPVGPDPYENGDIEEPITA
jgi:hypothetical protein